MKEKEEITMELVKSVIIILFSLFRRCQISHTMYMTMHQRLLIDCTRIQIRQTFDRNISLFLFRFVFDSNMIKRDIK
jgi:hypothetical protein